MQNPDSDAAIKKAKAEQLRAAEKFMVRNLALDVWVALDSSACYGNV